MTKQIYQSIEKQLLAVNGIKSVSLYNGSIQQLDKSLTYPAALVLFDATSYTDGVNGYQVGAYNLVIYILIKGAHKEVLQALDLVDRVAKGLHKFSPTADCSPMMRKGETMPDVFTDLFVFEQSYEFTCVDYGVVTASETIEAEGLTVSLTLD